MEPYRYAKKEPHRYAQNALKSSHVRPKRPTDTPKTHNRIKPGKRAPKNANRVHTDTFKRAL